MVHGTGAKRGAAELMEHKWFKKVDWDAIRNQQVRLGPKSHVNASANLA
jgi:hypothetical protein